MSAGGEPPRDSRDGSGSCGDRSSRAVIDQVAVPAYTEHARATGDPGPAIERHCMGTAPADAAAVRAAFDETMDAWQRAWPFTFGPVMQGAGRARIAFWPDRRDPGRVQRAGRRLAAPAPAGFPGRRHSRGRRSCFGTHRRPTCTSDGRREPGANRRRFGDVVSGLTRNPGVGYSSWFGTVPPGRTTTGRHHKSNGFCVRHCLLSRIRIAGREPNADVHHDRPRARRRPGLDDAQASNAGKPRPSYRPPNEATSAPPRKPDGPGTGSVGGGGGGGGPPSPPPPPPPQIRPWHVRNPQLHTCNYRMHDRIIFSKIA